MTIETTIIKMAKAARAAATEMARCSSNRKNAALLAMADKIENDASTIKEANQKDLARAKEMGLSPAMIDRLAVSDATIKSMAKGLREVAVLNDPVGAFGKTWLRPNGLEVTKMRIPIGVIGIIYESRPNVTIDAAALCMKSGNAAILRGGSEALHSNQALARCIQDGLKAAGLPATVVQVIETTDRSAVGELITMTKYVDVIVPRGGKSLIERVSAEARVPVIKHLHGLCHVYIDARADLDKAINIAYNAKTQRYGTCNTMETLLVDKAVAAQVLAPLARLYIKEGVELRGCEQTCAIIEACKPATAEDWDTEYLAPILSIRVVADLDEAIEHIHQHSSGHTEAIVTEDYSHSRRFLSEVDSSSVMVNASTRFADGFEYGLGAEIGISTDKIHARGPVGLEGLTSQKYIVFGDGHIRT